MTFDHQAEQEEWVEHNGSPDSIADWIEYAKDNATFRIGFTFAF